MNITSFAINNNRITITVLLTLFFAGINTYTQMPRNEDPGFLIRTAMVQTIFPGASPERVEMLITDPLEKAIQEIPEIDFISSESKTGISVLYVNIKESEKNLRPIWDNLRRKVERVTPSLPEGIAGPPVVNDEFGDVFGILIGLTGEGFTYAEMKEIADEVRDELLRIPDAAKVEISGAQEERIFVEYDNADLAELGISSYMLKSILDARNIITPGGDVRIGDERIVLEPSGNFESIDELKRTIVDIPGQPEVLYLEDIAYIRRDYIDPVSSKMFMNGNPALGLGVSLREGGNIIALGEAVEAQIERLQTQYPIGIEFEVIAYQHQVVNNKINDFMSNLLQAIGVVLLVMLLFLGVRTGLVVASLIPMAIVTSLFIMGLLDIGLDQVSLASLIIALGMLVDNAIVMSESVMVKMERGTAAFEAAVTSAKELRIPLLTSSLTTSAAFLPIFMAKSNVGEYTASIFKVVTIALLSSWILALTMIPMLCVLFLKIKTKKPEEDKPNRFKATYKRFLLASLRRPVLFVVAIFVVFIGTMQLFALIPNIFFPEQDRNLVTGSLKLPIGAAIESNQEAIQQLEKFIADSLLRTKENPNGNITSWATWIGEGAPKYNLGYNPEPPSSEIGVMLINTDEWTNNEDVSDRLESFCLQRFPDMEAVIKPLSNGPPVTNPIEIRISGKDPDRLFQIVERVKTFLENTQGPRNITDNWGPRSRKIFVEVNQTRAKLAGVTSQDIAISLQTVLSGFQTSEFREDDKVIPITMRNVAADRQDLGKLATLNIYSQQSGASVPLSQVAELDMQWQPGVIHRRDRYKTVTIRSQLDPGYTAINLINEVLRPWLEEERKKWPVGYKYEFGGELESSVKANQSIADQMPIAGFIILLLLISQFNSFRKTFIILITIPLGIMGVVYGLLIFKSYFGFMTLLGVISLAGIVINNAIVLIDRIQIEIDENKKSPQEAILDASEQRFRPILLTTATTVTGLIPLYVGGGPMWEPMAIAIMMGLVFATVLTLAFVPVMYRLLYRVDYRGYQLPGS